MKKLNKTVIMTVLAGILGSGYVSAAGFPGRGPIPFAQFDSDGNGLISEQEYYATRSQRMAERAQAGMPMRNAAQAPAFAEFDVNGDGQLTEPELAAGRQARMQGRMAGPQQAPGAGYGMPMGRGMGMGPGAGMGRNQPSFGEFDLNRDGVIHEQEFYDARARRISERAAQGYPMRGLQNAQPFSELDVDRDGRLSPEEFQAAQARHRMMRR